MLIALRTVSLRDVAAVGRKAAVLGELMAAGFAVPDGAVVAVQTLAGTGEDPRLADLATDLAEIVDLIGPGPYAVRSSGIDEDRGDASYAGQYETVLNVSADELSAAVMHCWSSASAERVRVYRAGSGDVPALAVLIQRMVPADAAGVAFTADPVTGDRNTVVVSAVRGLGDRLVSGEASPDEWVVRERNATCRRAPHHALDADTVLAVADLARRVEKHLGVPQDVEFAISGDMLAVLQARPITALPEPPVEPVPIPVNPPPGFWERESSHAPKPWTPMLVSVYFAARNDAIRTTFETFGMLAETMEFREIGGWDYVRLVPLGGKDRRPPPAWLIPLLIRAVPAIRRRIRDAARSVRDDTAGRLIERWYDELQPDLSSRLADLRDVDLAALDDGALAAHTDRAVALLREGCETHFLLHGALCLILGELARTCSQLLGWDDARTLDMLSGLSAQSTRPAHRLAELARTAADRPALLALLTGSTPATPQRLADTDAEFAVAFDTYLRDYGHRALRYEIADPTIAEMPALTLQLLSDQLTRSYDPGREIAALADRRDEATAAARTALRGRDDAERARFEHALARAERAYPVREDNEAATFSAPLALMRYAVLEHGRRLAGRGHIAARDDVFFLTLDEARAALAGSQQDLRSLITRRRGEHAWALGNPGPRSYGRQPGALPSLDALPAEARANLESLLWTVDRILEAATSSRRQSVTGNVITGIAASPGRFTGPVRVVMDELQFDKLRPGDVLVCPITSPVWSVLFPSVGALVTDSGGLLSHPAIIAREYRVPAVVATGHATELLVDGQLVTVDGSTGTVETLE
jgi:rifampicin phosphotransferase